MGEDRKTMRGWMAALTFACCVSAGTMLAAYEGPDYKKLKALLPPGPDAALCFTRTYDASHLKHHPHQNVTEMILSLRYVHLSDDDAILVATDDGGTVKQDFQYDFTLAAKTREHSETLYASGDCASGEAIGCGVECDGGGIGIEPVAGRDGTILVTLERIRMSLGCADGPDVDLEGGVDDKVFKLAKASPSVCEAMEAAAYKNQQ